MVFILYSLARNKCTHHFTCDTRLIIVWFFDRIAPLLVFWQILHLTLIRKCHTPEETRWFSFSLHCTLQHFYSEVVFFCTQYWLFSHLLLLSRTRTTLFCLKLIMPANVELRKMKMEVIIRIKSFCCLTLSSGHFCPLVWCSVTSVLSPCGST